ncbi:HIT-like protein [Punctularia strigosozonata HHB-11173 SS5]|uniref:HIT-like protein n=1 Tax=Punctularia strigosozonata (strain HHB-11173) TaxID=741275 RepID=R7S2C2_PUNST|nr:HIT-like protein [Punctularia strigosozonata HHB-11173 SS5]EIN04004.1 HIT-like protein [Punctularia strigosozonata HHB-11173 SS5]
MASTLKDDCLFCAMIQGKIPVLKLLETEKSLVFMDIGPVAEGHTLIIPKYHCNTMDEVPNEYLEEILPLAKRIAIALEVKDYNVLQNNGKIAHQHVFHVHFHVIPKPNETEGLGVGWPRVEPGMEALKKVQERVLSKL